MCALDELRDGQLPLTIPTASREAHFLNSAGWKATPKSPRNCDLQLDDSPNRSQRIMNCHIPKTHSMTPNSLRMNCTEPPHEFQNIRVKELTGAAEVTL